MNREAYPYLIEGIGQDIVPGNFDFDVIDFIEQVSDKKDAALVCRKTCQRKRRHFCGYSGGAVVQGVLQLQSKLKKGDVAVVILHGPGSRYINKEVYNDDWMRGPWF
ncbi:MAG: hypothetical protein U0T72_09070 [Chitinophagales bacterium]